LFAVSITFLVVALVSSAADLPKFSAYPVRQIFKGKPAEPQFRPGEDQYDHGPGHFRGGVSFDAERGPNFAGHYTLANWTCGSGCSGAIVVDAVTGYLYRDMPFEMLVDSRLDKG
jgi:hypothetical protein